MDALPRGRKQSPRGRIPDSSSRDSKFYASKKKKRVDHRDGDSVSSIGGSFLYSEGKQRRRTIAKALVLKVVLDPLPQASTEPERANAANLETTSLQDEVEEREREEAEEEEEDEDGDKEWDSDAEPDSPKDSDLKSSSSETTLRAESHISTTLRAGRRVSSPAVPSSS